MLPPKPRKVVFIGDAMVGKTSIIRAYHRSPIEFVAPTVGGEAVIVALPHARVNLLVWDTPGRTVYESIIPIYIRGAAVVVVVFDVTNRESFEHIPLWIGIARDVEEGAPIAIVGNKSDLGNREAAIADIAARYPDASIALRAVTSALTGDGIDFLFHSIAETAERAGAAAPPDSLVITVPRIAARERVGCPCERL
jgi:small GTP-binding protein